MYDDDGIDGPWERAMSRTPKAKRIRPICGTCRKSLRRPYPDDNTCGACRKRMDEARQKFLASPAGRAWLESMEGDQ